MNHHYSFFLQLFSQGRQHQPEAVLQLSPEHDTQCPQFNSWSIKFLAQGNHSSRRSQAGIEPGHQAWNLTITRLVPWQLGYCCPKEYNDTFKVSQWYAFYLILI